MDNEYINGYKSAQHRENRNAIKEANLSRKERWAIYKGVLSNIMPIFLIFLAVLILGICLLDLLWLR